MFPSGFFASNNMNEEIAKNLSKALSSFNERRVITDKELQDLKSAIVAVLTANKKAVESLNSDTKKQLEQAINYLETEHDTLLKTIKGDLKLTKEQVEKATKDQNDRAFKRLQTLIAGIRMPKDGKDGAKGEQGEPGLPGKDADVSPETIRDRLETLKEDERLDWTAIKGLPDYFKLAKKAGKQMLVGGIRFFENLADVSITNKRQDLLAQYNTTNNRWENGLALTVSATEPTSPQTGDLWVDIS